MKRLVLGILAHVDAGKTTLSEALLYTAGAIPALGRVDHRDAHLDTHALERARGITIFSTQALFETEDLSVTLLDTPGHVDFSAEMERTLQVLDYAILVISATDGVQAHTETLWRLLRQRQIPTFVFLTKMDLPNPGRAALMAQLRKHLDEGCLDFTEQDEDWLEAIAMREDALLDQYLDTGKVDPRDISGLIRLGKLFPCFFGSALHLDGVTEFLQGLAAYTEAPTYGEDFAARVFKIARDPQGNRLTYVKLTGGTLHVRDPIAYYPLHGEEIVEEKVTQLRLYSGEKFQAVSEVQAGQVCALLGLSQTWPGQGFGTEPPAPAPLLEPVVTYRLVLPPDCDPQLLLPKLRLLEEEDPQLHLDWDAENREIHARLMGQVQIEVLKQLIAERFQVDVAVDAGRILYKETIAAPVEGVGHFDPLRHYAEVHLLLEPLPQGSGVRLDTRCPEDVLDRNWQRLIMQHFQEREHLGVLTGSPITDMRITLLTGRAHLKHTEGGDFRQATYRAIRQGLMTALVEGDFSRHDLFDEDAAEDVAEDAAAADAKTARTDESEPSDGSAFASAAARDPGWCRVLEPWYRFRLDIPQDMLGRAMSDIQRMSGTFDPPEMDGQYAVLAGVCPVSEMRDYAMDVNAYTHGTGHLGCVFDGYRPCHNAAEVIEQAGYDPGDDLENTPDSVFCAHGAGYTVKWYRVPDFMHLDRAYDAGQ